MNQSQFLDFLAQEIHELILLILFSIVLLYAVLVLYLFVLLRLRR